MQKKNIAGKIFYISQNEFFFGMFFYLPKLTVLFGNGQQSNARAGQKKQMFFLVMRGVNLICPVI